MKTKQPTSLRLSPEGHRLISLLSSYLAVNRSAVIELAIREMAERKGVAIEKSRK